MSDETDDDNDIVNQLAYVRADPSQHDTATLLIMIDAAIAEIMGLRMQLRVTQAKNNESNQQADGCGYDRTPSNSGFHAQGLSSYPKSSRHRRYARDMGRVARTF